MQEAIKKAVDDWNALIDKVELNNYEFSIQLIDKRGCETIQTMPKIVLKSIKKIIF